jgi:hypothetical protein
MQLARFVRTIVPLVIFGFAGLMLGCSGPEDAKPVDKVEGKKIAEDMKRAAQEKAEQKKAPH